MLIVAAPSFGVVADLIVTLVSLADIHSTFDPFNPGGSHDDLPGGNGGVTGLVIMRPPLTKQPRRDVGHFTSAVVVSLALI